MRRRDAFELTLGFGKRDVEPELPTRGPRKQELKPERCLAYAWLPFDEINSVGR